MIQYNLLQFIPTIPARTKSTSPALIFVVVLFSPRLLVEHVMIMAWKILKYNEGGEDNNITLTETSKINARFIIFIFYFFWGGFPLENLLLCLNLNHIKV